MFERVRHKLARLLPNFADSAQHQSSSAQICQKSRPTLWSVSVGFAPMVVELAPDASQIWPTSPKRAGVGGIRQHVDDVGPDMANGGPSLARNRPRFDGLRQASAAFGPESTGRGWLRLAPFRKFWPSGRRHQVYAGTLTEQCSVHICTYTLMWPQTYVKMATPKAAPLHDLPLVAGAPHLRPDPRPRPTPGGRRRASPRRRHQGGQMCAGCAHRSEFVFHGKEEAKRAARSGHQEGHRTTPSG